MNLEILKDTMQDSNINFLIGSGLSCPYLPLLGNIETLLTDLDKATVSDVQRKIIKVSLYKRYFDGVISKNEKILKGDPDCNSILGEYKKFLRSLNSLLLKRKVTILSKEVNLFTSNIDIFLEKALDELDLEFNDGFNGRFKPLFNLSNFKICRFKKSLHFDKSAELPVFNLMTSRIAIVGTRLKGFGGLFSQPTTHRGGSLESAAGRSLDRDSRHCDASGVSRCNCR